MPPVAGTHFSIHWQEQADIFLYVTHNISRLVRMPSFLRKSQVSTSDERFLQKDITNPQVYAASYKVRLITCSVLLGRKYLITTL